MRVVPALWTAWWVLVTLAGLAGTIASINSIRFSRRIGTEMRALAPARAATPAADRLRLPTLPPPVQRYLRKAVTRADAIRSVHLEHGGTFRTALEGAWLPIRGEQYFRTDPPAFVWHGRVRMAPGVWVDARDRSVDGIGSMLVVAESTITIADSRGAQLDQAALLRLLGEMVWFPTAFLDARYVEWAPLDDRRASATLRVGGREVTGLFEFGGDDLPASFSAERFRDVGGGQAELTPFVGRYSDFRPIDGVVVPHRVVAAWVIDNRTAEYVDFIVDGIEFDQVAR